MAIHLEFNYGKRLGLPGYSSHNFSVSLKAEVTNPDQVAQEAQRIYGILQSSVDQQIQHQGFVPGNGTDGTRTNGQGTHTNGNTHQNGAGNGRYTNHTNQQTPCTTQWQCSDKQKNLITDILHRNNLDLPVVDDLAVELHGKPMAQLTKLEASGVVGEIISRYGRRQPAGSGGNGR